MLGSVLMSSAARGRSDVRLAAIRRLMRRMHGAAGFCIRTIDGRMWCSIGTLLVDGAILEGVAAIEISRLAGAELSRSGAAGGTRTPPLGAVVSAGPTRLKAKPASQFSRVVDVARGHLPSGSICIPAACPAGTP
jgi:hypothetical protein